MDKIYVIQMEQKTPSCMLCKKNPGKVTYIKEFKTEELLIVCDECLKTVKILGRDIKIEVTEEESKIDINLGRYVEVPCPHCWDKTTKVLREYYEVNKEWFDNLAKQRGVEIKHQPINEADYIEIICDYCPSGKIKVLKSEYEKNKTLFDKFHKK